MPTATARHFQGFTLGQFEYRLKNILYRNRAGFLTDITQEWLDGGNETWEKIYSITTRNPAVDIIVFSSVDIRTCRARDNGDDAVRLVLRLKTKKGYIYKRIGKHLRIQTLFDNVENSILRIQPNVFNLNLKEFTNKIEN